MKKNKLYILRGVSGSGKSTKAKELVAEQERRGNSHFIASADDFFVNKRSGEYEFDPSKLRHAHAWCKTRAEMAMELGIEVVVVDNTNTQKWEYIPYIDMADWFDYEVEVVRVGQLDESNLKVYANRNRHGVPLDVIRKQAKRFE